MTYNHFTLLTSTQERGLLSMLLITDQKIIFNIKIFQCTILTFCICLLCMLSTLYPRLANAEAIEKLQHNASTAYEQMMQAKNSAETLTKDVALAEKKIISIKQKLSAAEDEVGIAKRKAEQAKIYLEQATNRWKQATDALANEWGKSEIK